MKAMLIITASILLASACQAEWTGQMTVEEGVTKVTNPESAAEGEQLLEMHELWRRGGEDDEEVFFGTIAEFLHDDEGNIYLLDGQVSEIHIFDTEGELLETIGRQGEGPGEFQNGGDMFWTPDGEICVVQAFPGKLVMLTPDGAPGTTFSLPYRDGVGFQAVSRGDLQGDAVVLSGTAWARIDGKQIQFTYLKSYDMDGNELATYQETDQEVGFGNYEFIEENWVDFQRRWDVAPDGRVAAALSFEDYRIHVWNADGTLDRIIERPDYQAVPRSPDESEVFQAMYDAATQWNQGSTFRVNPNHNTVEQILFRDDGTLWVQSGADRWQAGPGVFTSFDVYDLEGRYVRKVTLKADADPVQDGLFFAGDRAFVVTDLLDAMMARMGGNGDADIALESEPVTVISFEFSM